MTVTLRNRTRLTVPSRLTQQAGFGPDDDLEFRVSRGRITIVSKPPFDKALVDIQADARKKGLHKMTMKQINALVAEVREEQRAKHKQAS